MRRLLVGFALAALTGVVSGSVHAQAPQSTVRVRVSDTSDAPIAGADISIVSGMATVVTRGSTNARGEVTLSVPAGAALQLIARHVGYQRATRFFSPGAEPMAISMRLAPVVATLAPVTVTAQEDVKRRAYHIDADEIASSGRNVVDGLDVLTKLRPDMIDSRVPTVPVNGRVIVDCSTTYEPRSISKATPVLSVTNTAPDACVPSTELSWQSA